MTDLTTRIADVKKKAEEAKAASVGYKPLFMGRFRRAASPSLIIAMADEIDRLTAQLEKAREALEPFKQAGLAYNEDDFWSGDKIDEMQAVDVFDLRTAARVHAELAEKEKE